MMGNSTSSSSSEDEQDQQLNILQSLSNFETVSPLTIAKAFCEAVDSDRKTLFKALHEKVQLNWFGRTVRRSKNVIKFLNLIAPYTSHQDISASEIIPDISSFSWDSSDSDEEYEEEGDIQESSNINGTIRKNSQASSNIDAQRDSSKLSKTDPKLPETSQEPTKTEKGQQKIHQYLTSVKNIKSSMLIELECKPLREDHVEVEADISKNHQNLGKIEGIVKNSAKTGGLDQGVEVGPAPVAKKDNLGKNKGVDQGIDMGSAPVTKKENLGKRHAEDNTFFESLRVERQENKMRENMEKSFNIEPELNNNKYDDIVPRLENIKPLGDDNYDEVVPKICWSKLKISSESESQKNCGDNEENTLKSSEQINKSNSNLENIMQVDETPEELSEVPKKVEKKGSGGIEEASLRQVLIKGTFFMGKAEKKGQKKRVWEKLMRSLSIIFDRQDIKFIEYTGASCARNLMKFYDEEDGEGSSE
ncbi:uncharacterized protein LOC111046174 [Nilaparvata lugens]|uniref:uncharacterized protein LOC111046174 n=1 Tax=Nilaparvata lugens TaxID=108931 RepID=UPI00193E2F80|nr:uncharacterized protein LOC111046174 [Nilaparvata lugens]